MYKCGNAKHLWHAEQLVSVNAYSRIARFADQMSRLWNSPICNGFLLRDSEYKDNRACLIYDHGVCIVETDKWTEVSAAIADAPMNCECRNPNIRLPSKYDDTKHLSLHYFSLFNGDLQHFAVL